MNNKKLLQLIETCLELTEVGVFEVFVDYHAHVEKVFIRAFFGGWSAHAKASVFECYVCDPFKVQYMEDIEMDLRNMKAECLANKGRTEAEQKAKRKDELLKELEELGDE